MINITFESENEIITYYEVPEDLAESLYNILKYTGVLYGTEDKE